MDAQNDFMHKDSKEASKTYICITNALVTSA